MKTRSLAPWLVLALSSQRLLELRVARANERWAREQGAVEYGQRHYWTFFLLHPGWLLCMLLEGRASRGRVNWWALALLLLLQPLRYWVIRTLGRYWNTRILVVPGGKRITGGPFQYLKHPNYAVVAVEMVAAPLTVGAWRTALAYSLLNAALLLFVRIPAEEAALQQHSS